LNRGIIAGSNAIYKIPQGFAIGEPPSLNKLRYYSLYWDKVVIPKFDFIPNELQIPQEEGFISAGILDRPKIETLPFGEPRRETWVGLMLNSQSRIAKNLMQEKDTDWVMEQEGFKLTFDEEHTVERNTLRIDLANCLPVPLGKVDAYDILEFKENRRDELLALHECLDELYQQVLLSPDQSLASKKAISNILKSIDNLDKVTQERFKIFTRENLSSLFNLYGAEIGKGIVMDAVTAQFTGMALPIVTVGNIINATIQVNVQKTPIFEPASKNLKLAYLSSAQKEGLY
jgi:hypothetical protein